MEIIKIGDFKNKKVVTEKVSIDISGDTKTIECDCTKKQIEKECDCKKNESISTFDNFLESKKSEKGKDKGIDKGKDKDNSHIVKGCEPTKTETDEILETVKSFEQFFTTKTVVEDNLEDGEIKESNKLEESEEIFKELKKFEYFIK